MKTYESKFRKVIDNQLNEKNKDKNREFYVKCPECGKRIKSKKGNNVPTKGAKCPNCGAKMDYEDDVEESVQINEAELSEFLDILHRKLDAIVELSDDLDKIKQFYNQPEYHELDNADDISRALKALSRIQSIANNFYEKLSRAIVSAQKYTNDMEIDADLYNALRNG